MPNPSVLTQVKINCLRMSSIWSIMNFAEAQESKNCKTQWFYTWFYPLLAWI